MERFTPGTTTYTLVIAVRLREPLDEDRLLRALAALPVGTRACATGSPRPRRAGPPSTSWTRRRCR